MFLILFDMALGLLMTQIYENKERGSRPLSLCMISDYATTVAVGNAAAMMSSTRLFTLFSVVHRKSIRVVLKQTTVL